MVEPPLLLFYSTFKKNKNPSSPLNNVVSPSNGFFFFSFVPPPSPLTTILSSSYFLWFVATAVRLLFSTAAVRVPSGSSSSFVFSLVRWFVHHRAPLFSLRHGHSNKGHQERT
ncbi:hypothetical protein RIF29_15780 [Crotalaria pallida]|uniref:Transmembrane protein n=1 Tax=Crotalaria pallida TaxID=3830 RepID=A0AAN9FMG4_CROPI